VLPVRYELNLYMLCRRSRPPLWSSGHSSCSLLQNGDVLFSERAGLLRYKPPPPLIFVCRSWWRIFQDLTSCAASENIPAALREGRCPPERPVYSIVGLPLASQRSHGLVNTFDDKSRSALLGTHSSVLSRRLDG
jgi:hypothetical protein